MIDARLLATGLLAALGAGCPQPCTGAGCADEFPGALVGVFPGGDALFGATLTPSDLGAVFAAEASQGPELDVALMGGLAWIGSPLEDTARRVDLGASASLVPGDEDLLLNAEADGDELGATLAIVPDMNGDGKDELAVGAPRRAASDRSSDDGSVYLFFGLGDALAAPVGPLDAANADLRLSPQDEEDLSATAAGRLGEVLVGCPDLDGDGLGDVAATAPWDSRAAALGGRVTVGLSSALAASSGPTSADSVGVAFTSSVSGARAGTALACGGDLFGAPGLEPDGLTDLVIGAPFADADTLDGAGVIYIVTDMAAGDLAEVADLRLEGPASNAWLGWSVALGDLNGDGVPELVGGAPGVTAEEDGEGSARGEVWLWDGVELRERGTAAIPRLILGEAPGDGFGRAVAIADLSGDGLADLVVGAPLRNPTGDSSTYEAGTVYLFLGSVEADDLPDRAEDADGRVEGTTPYLRFGSRLRSDDVDGDGVADLVLNGRYDPRLGLPQ